MKERLELWGVEARRVEQVIRYREDLIRFNRALNLVSRRGVGETVDRLLLEAAEATLRISWPEAGRVLDLGSGAGIPGVVIALVGPSIELTLLDRRRGRCDFLRREVLSLGLGRLQILEGEASVLGRDLRHRRSYDRVTLKAVATPAAALSLARPFLSASGRALLFQRRDWQPSPDIAERWRVAARIELESGARPHGAAAYELTQLTADS